MERILLVPNPVRLGISCLDGDYLMTIFECDFCKKKKSCTKVQIDIKQYDLCAECKKSLDKKLEGRGEFKVVPTGWTTYIYNSQPLFQQPQRPFYSPQITYTSGLASLQGTTGSNSLSLIQNSQNTAAGGMLGR